MKYAALIAAFMGFVLIGSPALAGEQCSCRYKGQDIPVGGQVCLKTPDGPRIATCGFELNNTSWKFTQQSCDRLAADQSALEVAMAILSRSPIKAPEKK